MSCPVLSTYRLQLRGPASGFGFTLADAERLLDYLDELGVSHLYLSPILTAVRGSSHGYDGTDPTTVSAELGGQNGLARLSEAARSRGMGLIVTSCPNHLGVGETVQNRLPIAPGTGGGTGAKVRDRQHYRLVGWRNGMCGYRRYLAVRRGAGRRRADRL